MVISRKNELISGKKWGVYMWLFVKLLLILVFCFCTSNMIIFYMCFEFTIIPTLSLIIGWGYQPERLKAGFYFVFYTITASLPLLGVISYMWFDAYRINLCLLSFGVGSGSPQLLSVLWVLSALAFLVKIPIYFFHLWLPKAHVEAPLAGSIILAGVLLKLGVYGLFLFYGVLYGICSFFSELVLVIGVWGGVLSCFICFLIFE